MNITQWMSIKAPSGWANLIELGTELQLLHLNKGVHLMRFTRRITGEYS